MHTITRITTLTALLLAALSLHATAREVEGIALPETERVEGATLQLNGAGVRSIFLFNVYVAGLYLPHTQRDAAAILDDKDTRRIELHVMRNNVGSARFLKGFREGIERNTSGPQRLALEPRMQAFERAFDGVKTVSRGDVIAFDWLPAQGTRITLNGRVLATIAGGDFYRALLSIWIGDKPVMDSLKQELLGE